MAGVFTNTPIVTALAYDPSTGVLPPTPPTTSLAKAVHDATFGVGYGGGAFLVVYYIGVSKVLQQLGIIQRGRTRTAGSSVGVMAQLVSHEQGMAPDEFLERTVALAEECRAANNCMDQSLGRRLEGLMQHLVTDAAWRGVDGRACVVVSWYETGEPVGDYTCSFKSKADMLEALRAGTFVPGWVSPGRHTTFRGRPVIDGAFSQIMPCPPNVTYCLKMFMGSPVTIPDMVDSLSQPGGISGRLSAIGSAVTSILGPQPLESIQRWVREDMMGVMRPERWMRVGATTQTVIADIYPGRWTKSPFTGDLLGLWSIIPPSPDVLRQIYKLGQEDGRAWAKAQGWSVRRRIV